MTRRRISLAHRQQRSILTDMLPFEVPPTFSNRGFYRFLRENSVAITGNRLKWESGNPSVDLAIRLLFGIKATATVEQNSVLAWGKTKTVSTVPLSGCRMTTIPFNFRVAHKQDGRSLSVVHPRNQVEVAGFYAAHASLITYHTAISDFSIRRPVSVARFAFYKDKLHEQRLETLTGEIEEEDREYEQLGSFFTYQKYRNIHRFFESYQYHRSEKKFDAMVQVDISKCFDSIYTHSICWAILGKAQTKAHLEEARTTFGDHFDTLMQRLNHNETNGIVIGPEFSRIFAEIILQSVDKDVKDKLAPQLIHKSDYDIFRYVDDYFLFYNQESTALKFIETLQEILKTKKLNLNPAKIKYYSKPIITEITVGKENVSELLNEEIKPGLAVALTEDGDAVESTSLKVGINSNRLITRYKSTLKESNVEYADLLNYTFAIVENKISSIIVAYRKSDRSYADMKTVVRSFLALLEFVFFAYSASPKVNHTIRTCRTVATCIDFLKSTKAAHELKHQVFKYIHDNIVHQLKKNVMSTHREVENLYLLISLSQIGKYYSLPESVLVTYFLITKDEATGEYCRSEHMNHFSITVLLTYIGNRVRYTKLKKFLEAHIVQKLQLIKAHSPIDSEAMLMLLDLIICPYLTDHTKQEIGKIFDLDWPLVEALQAANDQWFTAWGDRFDVGRELDAKRSREVY